MTVVPKMDLKRKRDVTGNDSGSGGNQSSKKFKCLKCEKSFDRYLNKQYHEQSCHNMSNIERVDLVGGSKRDSVDSTGTYTIGEYLSGESTASEQPYIRVVMEDVGDLSNLKQGIQHVIQKRLSVASQALKYMINVDVLFHKPLDDIITDPPVTFRSNEPTILGKYDIADINERVADFIVNLENKIENYTENGSGWRFERFLKAEIKLMQHDPVTGNKYLPLPPYVKNKHAIINIKNDDERCFLWSILAALHPQPRNANRVAKYMEYEGELNCEDISFPVDPLQHAQLDRFCGKNNLSLNILLMEQLDTKSVSFQLLHSTTELRNRHVNLLLIMDSEGQAHYAWIKDLSRLMAGRDGHKHKGHRFYCNLCLSAR